MAKILVVDDEKEIRDIVTECLSRDGHQVYAAKDGEEAYRKLIAQPDLLLLDVMMPGKDGFTLCRELRPRLDIPILFLTAKVSPGDLVEGLALGADEYIKKPFSIMELRARVNAHLRRESRERHNRYLLGGFTFDLAGFTLYWGEEKIPLTKTEYELAEYLALHHGQVFSKQQLFHNIWGYMEEGSSGTVVEHIRNLRRKIQEETGCEPIETVWGVGYTWKKESGG